LNPPHPAHSQTLLNWLYQLRSKQAEILKGSTRRHRIPQYGTSYFVFHNIHYQNQQLKEAERISDVTCMEKKRHTYKILVGKYEGKRPLGRPRHIWEDNGSKGSRMEDCTNPAQDWGPYQGLVNTVMNLQVP
jgi:hypothetical protein